MKLDLEKQMTLGAKIAAEQDLLLARRASDHDAAERAKARLRATLKNRPRVVRSPPLSKRILFVAAAAIVIGLFFSMNAWRHRAVPLAFQVDGHAAQQGAWLSAASDHSLELRFSDASDISLSPSARARVIDVDANGARIVLEAGTAHVSITHRDASRWHVIAGPFDVLVTGTEFDVAWDPNREDFRVHMQHGTVHVTGELLGEGHALSTGQSLEVSLPDGVVRTPEEGATLDAPPTTSDSTPFTSLTPSPRIGTTQRADTRDPRENKPIAASSVAVTDPDPPPPVSPKETSPAAPVSSPLWARLAANGEYARAVQNAEDTGFDAACASGKRSDVLVLGDAARFRGHDDEARAAYVAVRARGQGDDLAAEAAFDLGRLAFDRAHDYAAAARWFSTYENENPTGKLAREAAGRLIEARQRSGDLSGARDAARDYLARYPDGPHADLARSLVPEGSAPP